MSDHAAEVARCDTEIARCAEHVCGPGEFAGALMGWCDWQIEAQMVEEETA